MVPTVVDSDFLESSLEMIKPSPLCPSPSDNLVTSSAGFGFHLAARPSMSSQDPGISGYLEPSGKLGFDASIASDAQRVSRRRARVNHGEATDVDLGKSTWGNLEVTVSVKYGGFSSMFFR